MMAAVASTAVTSANHSSGVRWRSPRRYPAAIKAMPTAAAAYAGQPTATVCVEASAPMANSECVVVPGAATLPLRPRTSISPVRCASRSEIGVYEPTRLTWSSSVSRTNPAGSARANGPARTAKPPTAPPTRAPARLARDAPACGRAMRQAASSTAAGTAAQNLIATPQPNATPAQASQRGLARRPSRNAAFAASRQARFIHGSSSSVRPDSTSAG